MMSMAMNSSIYPWQHQDWQRLMRMYQAQRKPRALLVHGPEGMGKRQLATALAAWLLCERTAGNPKASICGDCKHCQLLKHGEHPDFRMYQREEGSRVIKIDQIRHLVARAQNTPQQGGNLVLLVDPADALNTAAFNALLKTLEEPVSFVTIILLAMRCSLLPATLRSRCQVMAVSKANQDHVKPWLQAQLENNVDALQLQSVCAWSQDRPLVALDYLQQPDKDSHAAVINGLQRGPEHALAWADSMADAGVEQFAVALYNVCAHIIQHKLRPTSATASLLGPFGARASAVPLFVWAHILSQSQQLLSDVHSGVTLSAPALLGARCLGITNALATYKLS